MNWKTARWHCDEEDGTISQIGTGFRLSIPMYYHRDIELANGGKHLGTIELPKPLAIDEQAIERLLKQNHVSLMGWVPGYNSNCYNDQKIFSAIRDTMRQISQQSGQEGVAIQTLQEALHLDGRIFWLHLLTLIEEVQGVVKADDNTVRLATWREAWQASIQIIEQLPLVDGEILPMVSLKWDGQRSYSFDWVKVQGDQYHLQLEKPSTQYRGSAQNIDRILQELMIPNGWAALFERRPKSESLMRQSREAVTPE